MSLGVGSSLGRSARIGLVQWIVGSFGFSQGNGCWIFAGIGWIFLSTGFIGFSRDWICLKGTGSFCFQGIFDRFNSIKLVNCNGNT